MPFPHILLVAFLMIVPAGASPGKQRAMFTDVTVASGIPSVKYAEGVNIFDLDGDGMPEIFLPDVKGRDRLYKNMGACRFEDVTDRSGIKESGGIGAVCGDVNADGLPDLYVVRGAYPYGLNLLYTQRPDGGFEDVTDKSGAASRRNGIGAVMGCLVSDGLPDIFVANWGVDTLYKNMGGTTFSDVTKDAGLDTKGKSWGAVLGDFNADGKQDIFVARGGPGTTDDSRLYINKGHGTFDDRSASSGVNGVSWAMGAVASDFDCDGDLDLFVTCYDGPDHLFINDGSAHFTDATSASGITSGHSMGATAGCVDNDLLPDLVVAGFTGPARLYINKGGGKFRLAVAASSGLGPDAKNEGVALGDVDGDGDLDLYVANYDGNNRLYRNNLKGGNFIKVRVKGGKRSAAGAEVRLYKAGKLLARQDVQAGYGFCSQSPMEALFRIPDGDVRYDLTVTFPGGLAVNKNGVGPGVLDIGCQ